MGALHIDFPSGVGIPALLTEKYIKIESQYDVGGLSDIWRGRWIDKSRTQEVSLPADSPILYIDLILFCFFAARNQDLSARQESPTGDDERPEKSMCGPSILEPQY